MDKELIEEGYEYQDFISVKLLKLGMNLNQFVSRKYQYEIGESVSGIEVKYDKKMNQTGNIYIELEEKHYGSNFVPSGVNRQDNTWIYLIGDKTVAYMFLKHQLKFLCDNYEKYKFKKVETETSKGILIPLKFLEEKSIYVAKKLKF